MSIERRFEAERDGYKVTMDRYEDGDYVLSDFGTFRVSQLCAISALLEAALKRHALWPVTFVPVTETDLRPKERGWVAGDKVEYAHTPHVNRLSFICESVEGDNASVRSLCGESATVTRANYKNLGRASDAELRRAGFEYLIK